jgi:hypothetical protein
MARCVLEASVVGLLLLLREGESLSANLFHSLITQTESPTTETTHKQEAEAVVMRMRVKQLFLLTNTHNNNIT